MSFLGDDNTIKEETEKRRIIPLFQVEYDRTLCKPLGTISDFRKLKSKLKLEPSLKGISDSPSRSPSPIDTIYEPLGEDNDLVLDVIPPKDVKKTQDLRGNALTVFEYSTAYPFIYGNNKFKCFICTQHYLDLAMLKQHMTETHSFVALKRLVNNRRENVLKVDINGMYCKICGDNPKDLIEMKTHLKNHDKDIDMNIRDNLIPFKLELVEDKYRCVICDQGFIKVRSLVVHMSVHFNNYSCEICGSAFMTLRLLKRHLEIHESGTYSCDRCNKVFSTPNKLTLHVRGVHLKQCPRRCPMCPERFNSNYKRTIHLQEVHNQVTRVHKCETCGRGFNLRYHLVCHIRSVHLQERNQQCEVCHQRYSNKESLKRHMVIHTGEKNHKCDVCGMAFLRRKNLKDHLRLHETE